MSRPVQEGGKWTPIGSLAPAVKLALLRSFLTVEALRGNETAFHLLRDLRGKPGEVRS